MSQDCPRWPDLEGVYKMIILFQLQIYSRSLEERLEEMGDAMVTERDHSNEIIRSKTKKVNLQA